MFVRIRDLLRECRLMMWPNGRIYCNLVGRDPDPAVTGTPAASGLGVYPAVSFNGSSYLNYGVFSTYCGGSKDFTLAFRARQTSTPADGGASGICSTRNGSTTSAGFIAFLGNTPGAGEHSWVFAIHGPGNSIFVLSDTAAASTYLNRDVVVVMVYRSSDRSITIYADGLKKATNIDSGHDWDAWGSSGDFILGAVQAGVVPFTGQIGWLGMWDRAFSDGDAFEVMQDHDFSFLRDGELNDVFPLHVVYSTSLAVGTATGYSGAVTYTTTVDATSDFTGDLTNEPESSETLYVTTVNVRSLAAGDSPEFARYVTSVAVTQVYSPTSPVRYVTQVLVSPHKTFRLDGRVDLLDSFRYRR